MHGQTFYKCKEMEGAASGRRWDQLKKRTDVEKFDTTFPFKSQNEKKSLN